VPYSFRVAAVNGSGMGLTAATSAPIMPRTTPGVATGHTGVAGNGRVTLSWTAPATNGGAAVSDYRVQYSSTNGMTWTTFADAVSATTTATVTGLTNGVSYVFRVATLNAAGAGAATAKSAAITPRTVAGVPTGLTATAVAGKVNLAWKAPAATGGAMISDYVVQYSSTSGTTWTTFTDATSASTSATVTGLSKGLSYVFRVATMNAAGRGAFSPKSTAVTAR
jgi:predicted phage tail protein